ncbi:hypothetical protein [Thermomonospora catenispora]|uniref:hypothetical protein n=1 Tax=Thermomonospora catenispora TaxID=2493090 RepID=UPI0019D5CD50|nr:hypothetical protein [Thermomonospora catenispora]
MPEFSVVLRGYDRHQVDEMVARIEAALAGAPLQGPPVTAEQLADPPFDVVVRGYDRFEVDEAMRRYRRKLAALEGAAPPDEEPDLRPGVAAGPAVGSTAGSVDGAPPWLLEQVAREHGLRVRWRGYDRHQVRLFLARLWAETGHPALRGRDVRLSPMTDGDFPPRFDVVLRGYDIRQVDDLVAGYRRRLGR